MKKKANESMEKLPVLTQVPVYFERVAGFLAKPAKKGTYPGIVMIHEWWGLNDNIKAAAKDLAERGYIVLAIDLYEGQVTNDQERAEKLVESVNFGRAEDNMKAAVRYLRDTEATAKVGSLGWCFGGTKSMDLALSGEPMNATVVYYGQLSTDKEILKKIYWPVMGIFGDKDNVVPVETVKEFEKALHELDIPNEIYIYPDLGHAFANPSNPNYAPEETKDAWKKMVAFLEKYLKG